MVYEEWLRRMENLFETIGCPERFKVHLAICLPIWKGSGIPVGDSET